MSRNQARKGKTLWTDRKGGDAVGLLEAWDADQEALYVADQTSKALAADSNISVAVLYRTNAQSRLIEESLRLSRSGIASWVGLVFTHAPRFETFWRMRGWRSIRQIQWPSSVSSTLRQGVLGHRHWAQLSPRLERIS